jgi:hypothetical protein
MPIDLVHCEPGSAFAGKTLNDFGVRRSRSGNASNPVVDRGVTDVEVHREGLHAVGLNEACEFGFPTSPDDPAHRLPPVLVWYVIKRFREKIGARGLQIPELLTQHSEATAVRAGSNLSNFRKKSSPLILKSNYLPVLNSTCVITQRDLADMAQLRTSVKTARLPKEREK